MAAKRGFLKLDGIVGESTDDRHRGEVDVAAWSFGVTHPATVTGTGVGSGRPVFDELHDEAPVSAGTPPLFAACASGRRLRTAVLTGVGVGGARRDVGADSSL